PGRTARGERPDDVVRVHDRAGAHARLGPLLERLQAEAHGGGGPLWGGGTSQGAGSEPRFHVIEGDWPAEEGDTAVEGNRVGPEWRKYTVEGKRGEGGN